jgi:hypothetical protein
MKFRPGDYEAIFLRNLRDVSDDLLHSWLHKNVFVFIMDNFALDYLMWKFQPGLVPLPELQALGSFDATNSEHDAGKLMPDKPLVGSVNPEFS